jgi:hypothetical protein
VVAFALPAFVTVAAWWFLLLPTSVRQSEPVRAAAARLGLSAWTAVLAGSVLLGLLMFMFARPLTRFLEGYYIKPEALRGWLVKRQTSRWTAIWTAIADERTDVESRARKTEAWRLFPREEQFILPLQLGNALRAGETYGWTQYGLSTPNFWFHLTSIAEDETRGSLEQLRSQLDQLVAWTWLSMGSLLGAAAVFAFTWGWTYLLLAVAFGAVAHLFYRQSVASAGVYSACLCHLVDCLRGSLAEALGLRLPADIAKERELWRAVNDYATFGDGWPQTDEWIRAIEAWRVERGAGESED